MFSWFKKKTQEATPAPPPAAASSPAARTADEDGIGEGPETPRTRAIAEEWELAIADALARVKALVEKATAESGAHIASLDPGYAVLTRLWSKTKTDVDRIREEVQERWDQILDQLSDDEVPAPHWVIRREGNKRDTATCELESRYWLAERAVMARAATVRKQRAQELGTKEAYDLFAANGGIYLGQYAARDAWLRMTRAQTWIHGYRNAKDVPMSLLEELEAASRDYWTQSLRVEAEHVPELAQYVDQKIAAYMKSTEKTLRGFWQWRAKQKERAGG
jgi:hypothetical protein